MIIWNCGCLTKYSSYLIKPCIQVSSLHVMFSMMGLLLTVEAILHLSSVMFPTCTNYLGLQRWLWAHTSKILADTLHIKHITTHTKWLSLLLTLTLSICLPMTVSQLCDALYLWVCLPKWSVCLGLSVSEETKAKARVMRVFLRALTTCINTHCLHVPSVCVDVWVFMAFVFFFLHLHLQCFCVSECDERSMVCWWQSNSLVDASFFLSPKGKVLFWKEWY